MLSTQSAASSCVEIASWSDYVKQNKFQRPIWFHLSNLASTCWREGIHKRKDCIHQQLGLTVDSMVDTLIGIVSNESYSVSVCNISRLIFGTNPFGKKLCTDCILLFLFKTDYCQTIINHYYQIYCSSNRYIQSNVCVLYFSQIILTYPLVIKSILSHTSTMKKLFQILIFYLKEIKLDSLQTTCAQFVNFQKQYKIINRQIVAMFMFEFNLSCILSMFEYLIPYFNRNNLSMLTKLNFTTIYTSFILKYSSLKHIKANINAFYKKSHKYMMKIKPSKEFEQATSGPLVLQKGTVHTYFTTCNLPIDDMVNRRNAMMHKLVGVYCYYLQKIKKFKDHEEFKESYNHFSEFGRSQMIEFKRNNEISKIGYDSKIRFFFTFALCGNLHPIKAVRTHYKKWKICSNDKCKKKKKKKKLNFKMCSGCKLVLYCSRRCQKRDWVAGHRCYCKLILC